MTTTTETFTTSRGTMPGPEQSRQFGIVLQGGGALGAYEAGVIDYLYTERGMRCTIAGGCSIGAINAVTLAGSSDPAATLKELWKAFTVQPRSIAQNASFVPTLFQRQFERNLALMSNPGMYAMRTDPWNAATWTSFYNTAPLRATLERLVDFDLANDSKHMRLVLTACNVESGKLEYFSNRDGGRITPDHVLASGSLPPGFPPTLIDHSYYMDGGLFDNTPMSPVIEGLDGKEPGQMPIFVVDLFPEEAPVPRSIPEMLNRMLQIAFGNKLRASDEQYRRFIDVLQSIDKELSQGKSQILNQPEYQRIKKYCDCIDKTYLIDIPNPSDDQSNDFSAETIGRRMDAGYSAAKRCVEKAFGASPTPTPARAAR